MGQKLCYATLTAVEPAVRRAVKSDARRANRKRRWALCEPISFSQENPGDRLSGFSKLCLPTAANAAPADGDDHDLRGLVGHLCRWSAEYALAWQLRLEDEVLGTIVDGRGSAGLWERIDGLASLGDFLGVVCEEERAAPIRPFLRIWPEPE